MGTQFRSITVKLPLVERLQTPICCSGTKETCRDDDFCSSSPEDWPHLNNGTENTRLTYPADKEKPSIPGVPHFCSAYLDWYTRTSCGPLAKDVAMALSAAGRCAAGADPQSYIDRILQHIPAESRSSAEMALHDEMKGYAAPAARSCSDMEQTLARMRMLVEARCSILYDDAIGGRQFNPDRAEDLNNLAEFCQTVGSAEQQRLHAGDPNLPHWKDFFKGGGFAAAALGVVYALYHGVRAIVRIGRGISEADAAINSGSKGLKHFFGVTLRNVGRATKYVFGLGWLRGKAPPPDVPDPAIAAPGTATPPQRIDIHVHAPGDAVPNGAEAGGRPGTPAPPPGRPRTPAPPPAAGEPAPPHPDVVRAQFSNLTSSDRYGREGLRFASLSETAQRYLAHHAAELWGQEPPERQGVFIADDSRLTEGKLPIDYLLEVARRFLAKDEMLSVIEASARVWQERGRAARRVAGAVFLVADIGPAIDVVRGQLLTNSRYSRLSVEAQEYFARRIIASWELLSHRDRAGFSSPRETIPAGGLPQGFLRFARKRGLQKPREIERKGVIVAQVLREMPELSHSPFAVIDLRADDLLSAWRELSPDVQAAFVAQDQAAGPLSTRAILPHAFVQHTRGALRFGASARPALRPQPDRWSPGEEPTIIGGLDQRDVMQAIVGLNDAMAFYPALLDLRARAIIQGWTSLDDGIRTAFRQGEDAEREGVPLSYVGLWQRIHPAVGTSSRDEQRGSFGGIVDGPESGAGEVAPGLHDTQPLTRDEMVDVVAGAAAMTAETAADALPLAVPTVAGTGLIVK